MTSEMHRVAERVPRPSVHDGDVAELCYPRAATTMHKSNILFHSIVAACLAACGGSGSGGRCAATAADARPVVALDWQVEHGSMDDDPPRPRVTLIVRAQKEEKLVLGELRGVCHLVELGAPTDQLVEGGGVSELVCEAGDVSVHARVVHEKMDEIFVRLWESQGDAAMKNVRDVPPVAVPACARFTSEIAQPNEL